MTTAATCVIGGLPPSAANARAAAAIGPGDVFAVLTQGGSAHTEVHALSRASGYRTFSVHAATGLGKTNLSTWSFAIGDYNGNGTPDLFAINTRDNGGRNTAAHVFSSESNFRTALLHRRLPSMGATSLKTWQFIAGDYTGDGRADLVAVNTRDNAARNTAAHVLNAANGFGSYALHRRLPSMGATNLQVWQFAAGDYTGDGRADLVAVNTRDNGGRNTAAHVLNAANGFGSYALHRRLPSMGSAGLKTWQFTVGDHDTDGRADLVAVNTRDGSKKTAVHVLSAKTAYGTYLAHSVSGLHPTSTATWQFHGWVPRRRPATVRPNPYPAEEVTHGWTRRMRYVVDQLNAAMDPRSCGGQATGSNGGHVPGSDHYSGNAADCFAAPPRVIAAGADKRLGDAMANWAVANGGPLKLKQVIWYGRYYNFTSATPGWRPYCHPSLTPAQCAHPAPNSAQATLQHMDHAHISVLH